MLSAYGQENIVNAQQNVAARKPLNQASRVTELKASALGTKTPFRSQPDENQNVFGGKKNATFVTPAPKTARPALGVKTTNAKAAGHALQTPALDAKLQHTNQPTKRVSSSRPAIKKKIYVAPEEDVLQAEAEDGDDEPEVQYCPPPIVPLPDNPFDLLDEHHETYSDSDYGAASHYLHLPKDENGVSVRLKMEEQARKESLERDLAKINLESITSDVNEPDAQVAAMIIAGSKKPTISSRPASKASLKHPGTLKARAAAHALSEQKSIRTHQRLPSAATKDTIASKSKRKQVPNFSVAQDDPDATTSQPLPISRSTIGFPKARKAPSILPRTEQITGTPKEQGISKADALHLAASISPQKFVQLYGEPPMDSEMWFRLMQLEINDRHRDEDRPDAAGIFDLDEEDASYDAFGMDDDDFQLPM